jgi:hypothetical protein
VTLVTEGNSEKGIADIRAIIQKTGAPTCGCSVPVRPGHRLARDQSSNSVSFYFLTISWLRPDCE